jgi:hypothetical protein
MNTGVLKGADINNKRSEKSFLKKTGGDQFTTT